MSDVDTKRRIRITALILGAIALAIYMAFIYSGVAGA